MEANIPLHRGLARAAAVRGLAWARLSRDTLFKDEAATFAEYSRNCFKTARILTKGSR